MKGDNGERESFILPKSNFVFRRKGWTENMAGWNKFPDVFNPWKRPLCRESEEKEKFTHSDVSLIFHLSHKKYRAETHF